jgi:hypothetical protein
MRTSSAAAFAITNLVAHRAKKRRRIKQNTGGGQMAQSKKLKGLRTARLSEEEAQRAIYKDLKALKHYLKTLSDTSNACRELVDAAQCPQATGPAQRLGTAFKRYVEATASGESIVKISDHLIKHQRKLKEIQEQPAPL